LEYLYITWKHSFIDEPNEFFIELNEHRIQVRVLEIYENGEIAYASNEQEFNTFLATEEYPIIDEINKSEEFKAKLITKEYFEKIWLEKTEKNI